MHILGNWRVTASKCGAVLPPPGNLCWILSTMAMTCPHQKFCLARVAQSHTKSIEFLADALRPRVWGFNAISVMVLAYCICVSQPFSAWVSIGHNSLSATESEHQRTWFSEVLSYCGSDWLHWQLQVLRISEHQAKLVSNGSSGASVFGKHHGSRFSSVLGHVCVA